MAYSADGLERVFPSEQCLDETVLTALDNVALSRPSMQHHERGAVAVFDSNAFDKPGMHTHIQGSPKVGSGVAVNPSVFLHSGEFLGALEQNHGIAETVKPVPLRDSVGVDFM